MDKINLGIREFSATNIHCTVGKKILGRLLPFQKHTEMEVYKLFKKIRVKYNIYLPKLKVGR